MRIGLVRGLVALLLLPGISHALGLGDVHLNSPLNAPLDAEVELVNATAEDLATLDAKLASKEAGAGLPPVIPEGMRAVSVRVNEVIGVAGYVLPGTRVDVVAVANPTENRGDTTSKLDITGPGAFSVEIGGRTQREAGWIGSIDTLGLIFV